MRILLIIPAKSYTNLNFSIMSNNDFPVGFAYISSVLRNAGHKIYGLNLNNIYGYNSSFEMINDQIIKSIEENQPELIGIGGLCIDYKFIKDAIFIIRKINPDIPVVLGGGIVNNDAEFILDSLRPDFGIIGEAEEAIVKLADKIENNDLNFSDISNIGFFQNGKLELTNKNYDYIDINALPYPDYEPFNISEMIENYSLNAFYLHRYPRKTPRIMTIVTARSCPFSCTFCVHMHGSKYRARSIENIMSEIKYMYDKYQFNILVMMDELFAVNKNRLNLFCTELIAQKEKFGWDFNWYFQTHSSAALTEKELNLAKQSGCYLFSYGIESGSETVLKSMNKKNKLSAIAEAFDISSKVQIGFGGNFIFGDIAETENTITETLDFVNRHCINNHIFFGEIQPYPGSKIFEYCLENSIISDKQNYYDNINKNKFNMTSINNKFWRVIIKLLQNFSDNYYWDKKTYAVSINKKNDKPEYIIKSVCPHCGSENESSEKLNFDDKMSDRLFYKITSKINGWKKMFKLYRKLVFVLLVNVKMFRLLNQLLKSFDVYERFFITGCVNCNKRFKIILEKN